MRKNRSRGLHAWMTSKPWQKDLQAENKGPEKRREVFDRIAERAFGFGRQRVAPDVDAVDRLVLFFVALAGGADDRHRIAGVAQRGRFLPHPPVERARQVLHQDENSTSHYLMAAMRTGLSRSESSDAHRGKARGKQPPAHFHGGLLRGEVVLARVHQAVAHAFHVQQRVGGVKVVHEVAAPRDVDRRPRQRDLDAVAQHDPEVAGRAHVLYQVPGDVDRIHALHITGRPQRQ